MRWIMAAFYAFAGVVHLAYPAVFMPVMPAWVPYPHEVILLTGIAELFGAAGLLTRRFRWWAGVMLAAYAVCVFPANLRHAWLDIVEAQRYGMLWYHVPRLPMQPVLIWWALYSAGVINWPWRRAAVAQGTSAH
ncbi:hypothetical protein sos41_37940 [Alphaproteobacteria bacterium SO-S41]|nr:hypothetical protein sos41_37940 [Alphaproteobacteria bacterium SO-S41]